MNAALAKEGNDPVKLGGAYKFNPVDAGVYDFVTLLDAVWLIEDVGNKFEGHVRTAGNPRHVIITSPNADRIKRIIEAQQSNVTLFMPTWSEEELLQLNSADYMQNAGASDATRALSVEELRRRFRLCGGVPRHIFARKDPLNLVTSVLQDPKLDLDLLHHVFRTKEYRLLKQLGEGFGILVRIEPLGIDSSEKAQQGRTFVATNEILELMRQMLISKSADENFRLFQAVSGIPAFQAWRGYFLEVQAHAMLVQAGRDKVVVDMHAKRSHRPDWLELEQVKFRRTDMGDLLSFEERDYAQPDIPNFPTLDAFAVLPLHIIEEGAKAADKCLAMFQFTVSRGHVVRGPDLTAVHEKAVALTGIPTKKLAPCLVFVTPRDGGVAEVQPVLNKEGHVYERPPDPVNRVKQYTLYLGGRFEEIANGWKDATEVIID